MTINIAQEFSKRFPNASTNKGIFWAGLSVCALAAVFHQIEILTIAVTPILVVGVLLIIGWFGILPLDLLLAFAPQLKFLWLAFIKPIVWIRRLLTYVYKSVVIFLVKPAVIEILNSYQQITQESYRFVNQEKDDHTYEKTIDLSQNSLSLDVNPTKESEYWRFGLKFRNDELFNKMRTDSKEKLFHVYRNSDLKTLHVVLYENDGVQKYDKALEALGSKSTFVLKTYRKGSLTNVALYLNKQSLLEEEIGEYKFAQIRAWGDGKAFTIDTVINLEQIPTHSLK